MKGYPLYGTKKPLKDKYMTEHADKFKEKSKGLLFKTQIKQRFCADFRII